MSTGYRMFALMLAQSLALCLCGGALGVALAVVSQPLFASMLGTMFPGYTVMGQTILLGLGLAVLIGLLAGIVPAWAARRLESVQALRAV